MKLLRQNLGIEIDSKFLKICLSIIDIEQKITVKATRKFGNNLKGIKELYSWLEKKKEKEMDIHLTMEATGNYYENLAYFFESKPEYIVHVLLPNVSRSFARSLNIKSKNDDIDAKMLARLGCERKLKEWHPSSDQMREIKRLSRERIQLSADRTQAKNRLHSIKSGYRPDKTAIKRTEKRIEFIEKQIKQIENQIAAIVKKDEQLQERIDNITTISGIGFITSITVVAELNGFAIIENGSQLVSYCGYDVKEHKSGSSNNGKTKISKQGNSYVRAALYMPSLSTIRYDEHAKKQYIRLVQRHGIKMKALVAIQRKLLILIYTLYKNNVPYDPEYHVDLAEKLKPKSKKLNENKAA